MIILNINRIVPNYTKKNINIHILKRFYPGGMNHIHKVVNALNNTKTFKQPMQLLPVPKRSLNIAKALKKKQLQDDNLNKPTNIIYYVSQNKNKDVFMKTVEQINEIPYDKQWNLTIPTTHKPIVSSISGIWQVPTQITNNNEFEHILAKMSYKFVHSFFKGPLIQNKLDLFLRIEDFIQKDILLNNIYYYPLAQHMITSVFARMNIPAEVLEHITENLVDYSAYKNFNVASVSLVEASVFKITMLDFIKENQNNLRIIAQNPDNLLGDHTKFASLSYKQGKQPHMDFRIENYSVETTTNKMVFLDSKLYADPVKTLSLSRGYLSLSTSIDYDYLMKRFNGDIVGSAVQKGASEQELFFINQYKKELITTILNNKHLNINEKKEKFVKLKKDMLLDKNIKIVVPSFIFIPMDNILYNNYVNQNTSTHEEILKFIVNDIKNNNKLQILIPAKGQQAHVNVWHKFLLDIIKRMPVHLQDNMFENFHRFKLIEYDYDL